MDITKLNIKDMVGNGRKVRLERFQSGSLVYVTETGFRFKVPVTDLGEAAAYPEDNAMTYMKWIKEAIKAAAKADEPAVVVPETEIKMKVLTTEDVESNAR